MAIESLSTAGVPDLGLQPPHIIPRVQVRKYGEQKKLFISAGLLPESPSEPGLPKSEHMVTPKVDHGESGWEHRCIENTFGCFSTILDYPIHPYSLFLTPLSSPRD